MRRIFAIYFLVLIMATAVVSAMPKEEFPQQMKVVNKETSKTENAIGQFYQLISKGKTEKLNDLYKRERSLFRLQGQELELIVEGKNMDGNYQNIWIERTNSKNGEIEFNSYIAPYIVDNIDITANVLSPAAKLIGNRLVVVQKENIINIAKFEPDFTSRQFMSTYLGSRLKNSVFSGAQAIYLRISKDIKVNASGLSVTYVQKK